MKSHLVSVPSSSSDRPQTDNYHDRTGHQLKPEESKVFSQLQRTEQYAYENGMRLNYKKTKINPGINCDFLPKFNFKDINIEIVEEVKLLGVDLRSDLSWSSNTDYLVTRANSKLWFLRRLKNLGTHSDDLKDIYIKQLRSILKFAVPVLHSCLIGEDRLRLLRIQKTAMHIILGSHYKSYSSALGI